MYMNTMQRCSHIFAILYRASEIIYPFFRLYVCIQLIRCIFCLKASLLSFQEIKRRSFFMIHLYFYYFLQNRLFFSLYIIPNAKIGFIFECKKHSFSHQFLKLVHFFICWSSKFYLSCLLLQKNVRGRKLYLFQSFF